MTSFPHARSLLPQCLLGGIVLAVIGAVFTRAAPPEQNEWVLFALFYIGGGAVLALRIRSSRLDVRKLFGAIPSRPTLRLTLVALPMMAFSIAGFWLLFLPLSYLLPGFVRTWGLANANMKPVVTLSAWIMQVIVAVILAPIAEETLFRGLLLQRWAEKWGTWRAVLATSALFAVGHVELLGHFVFGLVMCALYLRTRSLWVPIATHALNNAIVSVGTLSSVLQPKAAEEQMTLESLRSQWWVAPVLLAVGVALLEWYRRRYWAGIDVMGVLKGEVPYRRV
ncbi:MAG TPA: type II CAAX endopeptidase family protein [Gemmatimonadaceae bacterium]